LATLERLIQRPHQTNITTMVSLRDEKAFYFDLGTRTTLKTNHFYCFVDKRYRPTDKTNHSALAPD